MADVLSEDSDQNALGSDQTELKCYLIRAFSLQQCHTIRNHMMWINYLTHCILVDYSTFICWTSPFAI